MKTTITINSYAIRIAIAGVTIRINRDELFHSIDTVTKFVHNIWPEEHKKDLESLGILKVLNNFKQYQPFAERLLACYKFEGTAKSIITINEDGTVDLFSNEQSASIDMKGILQVISDLDAFQREKDKKEQETNGAGKYYLIENNNRIEVTPWNLGHLSNLDPEKITELLEDKFGGSYSSNIELNRNEIEAINDEFPSYQISIDSLNEVRILEQPLSMEEEYELRSTDQSMEVMDDKELEFKSRPTNPQLCAAISNKLGQYIPWDEFSMRLKAETGMNLDPKLHASTSICIKACDAYGLQAICKFNTADNYSTTDYGDN